MSTQRRHTHTQIPAVPHTTCRSHFRNNGQSWQSAGGRRWRSRWPTWTSMTATELYNVCNFASNTELQWIRRPWLLCAFYVREFSIGLSSAWRRTLAGAQQFQDVMTSTPRCRDSKSQLPKKQRHSCHASNLRDLSMLCYAVRYKYWSLSIEFIIDNNSPSVKRFIRAIVRGPDGAQAASASAPIDLVDFAVLKLMMTKA